MAREIAPETKWLAKCLYCADRLSFAETARESGVSVPTLRKWAEHYHWNEEREAIASTEWEIRDNTVKARAMALRKLLAWEGDKDTALALGAVDKLERLALAAARSRKARSGAARAKDEQAPAAEGFAPQPGGDGRDQLARLEEAVNRQISHILSNPVANMAERMRDIKAGLDVLAALKGKEAKASVQVSFDE